MSYGVSYISPDWCYGGLTAAGAGPNLTNQASWGGYGQNITNSLRLYSQYACENLLSHSWFSTNRATSMHEYVDAGGRWFPNGECNNIGIYLNGTRSTYNAAQVCAGLNNDTSTDIVLPIVELDYTCDEPPSTLKYRVTILILSILLVINFVRFYVI